MNAESQRNGRPIVLVSHSREVGGAEVYLENLVQYLAASQSGWRPELICRRDRAVASWADGIAQSAPVARLDVVQPRDLLRMTRDMRAASLVQLNLSYPTGKYPFTAAMLAATLGRPLVVTHHLALRVGAPWHQFMMWLGRTARKHIAVSNHSARVLLLDYDYPRDRVEVIHNGIDPTRFRPASPEARAQWRQSIGVKLAGEPWGEGVQVACTVARLSTQKGLFDLIEAASTLGDLTKLRMVVIGDGELRRSLAQRIQQLHLDHLVFLTGAVSRTEVAQALAASDLFVLPSRYEGGPATALIEAMACECAVVATDVSGTSELVIDASLGRLVPPQDPAALAMAIRELLADPGLRSEIGRRGRERVLADFTIAASMEKTAEVFEAAALSPARSPAADSARTPH